ncbi:MAG: DoxX family protein [Proteobacteria bacterium]|nr:DoxX family protein [Pseudomonadota bacterium]MBS0550122.1 DoxX family protein [Pseudomonadota bacterium]
MRDLHAHPMAGADAAPLDESGNASVLLVARCLVAGLFLWSGIGQVQGYDETASFMIHNGVMANLLPVAVFIELAGAILLIAGYRMRFTSLALASFCVLTALLFHANFFDHAQMFHFLKNCAIAGGLLSLYVSGPGRLSLDGLSAVEE